MMILVPGGIVAIARAGIAADPAYGEYLAAECATCHHSESTVGAIPSLRVIPYGSLVTALKEYRNGIRGSAAMQAVARSLGDQEIEALAAYFSRRS